jgi:hypothetical protein
VAEEQPIENSDDAGASSRQLSLARNEASPYESPCLADGSLWCSEVEWVIHGYLRYLNLGDTLSCWRNQSDETGLKINGVISYVCPGIRRFVLSANSAPWQMGSVLVSPTDPGMGVGILHGYGMKSSKRLKADPSMLPQNPFVYVDELPLNFEVYSWKTKDFTDKNVADIYRAAAELDDMNADQPIRVKSDIDLEQPATRGDIAQLRAELRAEMQKGNDELRAEMQKGNDELRAEMQKGNDELRAEMKKGNDVLKAEIQDGIDLWGGDMLDGIDVLKGEMQEGFAALKEMISENASEE